MDWWNLHFKVGVVVLGSFILFAFFLLMISVLDQMSKYQVFPLVKSQVLNC